MSEGLAEKERTESVESRQTSEKLLVRSSFVSTQLRQEEHEVQVEEEEKREIRVLNVVRKLQVLR